MEKNILLKFTAESDLQGVDSDLQNIRDREREIMSEMRKLQADYQKQVYNIQATVKGREEQVAAIEKVRVAQDKQQKSLESEMSKSKASFSDFVSKMSHVVDTIAKGAASTPKFNKEVGVIRDGLKNLISEGVKPSDDRLVELVSKIKNLSKNIEDSASKTPKLTTQLREMKNELSKMEEAGVSLSDKGFIDMAVKAAALEDQIGDTRQRIQHLASDTKNLDAALNIGEGLAGTFTVATSAAALLGGESEELQKAFFKVQAVLSVLNGVQQMANVLNKDSIANVVIGTAVGEANTTAKIKNTLAKKANVTITALETSAEKGNTAAKVAATVAQKALNLAMKANPAGLIITAIVALAGALIFFSKNVIGADKAMKNLNATLADTKRKIGQIDKDVNFDVAIAKAAGKSVEEIRKITYAALNAQAALADLAMDAAMENRKHTFWSWLGFGDKVIDQKAFDEAKEMQDEAYKAIDEFNKQVTVEEVAAATDRENKKREAAKQAHEKAMQDAEQRKREIIQAQKELEDALNAQMADGLAKEINAIQLNYERRREAIQGESAEELELKKQLLKLEQKEIEALRLKYAQEDSRKAKELELLKAENAAAGSVESIALKKAVLERESELDILAIEQSKDSEEMKAEKIKAIRLKLASELAGIDDDVRRSELEGVKFSGEQRIAEERHAAEMILASNASTFGQRKQAREKLEQLEKESLENEEKYLDALHVDTLIKQEEYEEQLFQLKEQYRKQELDKLKEKADYEKELQKAVFDFGVELANMAFSYKREQLQREMEDVEHYYTTDAEEAKKNSDKKLISEQALAQKKLEIKRKQAKAEKEEALFNIAVATAQSIMQSAKMGFPQATPFVLMATALGLLQAGVVASKPLPKYAKGRKGGKGEWAIVGELGPEKMWVPDGASIVPHNRKLTPDTMREFGIPYIDEMWIKETKGTDIDYDKMGKALAKHMPAPQHPKGGVTVNVDKSGITVRDGNSTTTFLNKKYTGRWN